MEIKLNASVFPVSRAPVVKPTGTAASGTDQADFKGSKRLEQLLQDTPEVRPERVKQAEQLLGDVTYPPPETIRRLATLLALRLDTANPTKDDAG